LPGSQKAAILMACLGPQNASKILAGLNEDEVDRMTLELSSLGTVDTELKSTVLDEFYQMAVAKQYVAQGGLDMAKELLERSFGPDKAFDILNRLQASLQEVPFQFLKRADPGQVSTFIQDEHPQTIALIVAHLDPGMGALILSALGPDVQSDVIMRIATMDRTAPEIVREVERVIERKMAAVFTGGFTFAGGVKAVAEILNRVERTSEKAIMADLGDRDPELADEIGRLMFTFEDVIHVDDAGIQRAMREIESKDLALALKGSNDDLKAKIYRNMSSRAAEMIKEELEFMGPVRMKNVEEAQQKIVAIVRRLEESGELVLSGRGGGDADEILV
jgi:flagellar motor switch protein FliG